jgi:hypothetical protein
MSDRFNNTVLVDPEILAAADVPSPNGSNGVPGAPTAGDPPPAGTGRDSNGRFLPGCRGGPGNPHARRVGKLRTQLLDYLTPQRLEQLLEGLFQAAVAGDVGAAKLLLGYSLGQPSPALEIDRLDHEEIALLAELPKPMDVAHLSGRVLPSLVLQQAGAALVTSQDDLAQRLAEEIARQRDELDGLRAKMDRLLHRDYLDEDDDLTDLDDDDPRPPRGAA